MLKAEQEKDKVAPAAGAKVQRHFDSAAYPEMPSKPGEVNCRPSPAASTTGVVLVAPERVTSVQASWAKEETLGGGIVVIGEATTSQSKPVLTTGSRLLLKRTWISEL